MEQENAASYTLFLKRYHTLFRGKYSLIFPSLFFHNSNVEYQLSYFISLPSLLGDIRITSTKDEFVLADVDIMVSEWMNEWINYNSILFISYFEYKPTSSPFSRFVIESFRTKSWVKQWEWPYVYIKITLSEKILKIYVSFTSNISIISPPIPFP